MKIRGIDPKSLPCEEVLVIPRGDEQIVFKARSVIDMTEFEKLCPEPVAPGKLTKDGFVPNKDDKTYRQQIADYSERQMAYIVLKSLEASDIEWETVQIDNPKTWLNWTEEMKASGFNQIEIKRVFNLALEANSLNEAKLEAARKVFLLGQRQASENTSGQDTEQ